MALSRPSGSSQSKIGTGRTEFEILKASHKFLRDDDNEDEQQLSWDDQVARKYYSSLYREFAVCDLKHYKSGSFALRWRTEAEVLSGAGEETCGNTRCIYHEASKVLTLPSLRTVELPFAYEEHGEQKAALVKVVLCDACLKKLLWKKEKDRQQIAEANDGSNENGQGESINGSREPLKDSKSRGKRREKDYNNRDKAFSNSGEQMPRANSRSKSPVPRRSKQDTEKRRRRSPT